MIVELPTGKIKGRKDISLKRNVSFYSFLQIPYGQPPTGKLRFMSPKPAEKWEGVLDFLVIVLIGKMHVQMHIN